MVCKLCEKREVEVWFGNWCASCRKIKHYLNLYDERVIEILDSVLSRTDDKQENKIKMEIQTEIENKEKCLEYRHKKYSENKEDILNRQKIKTKCECGSVYNRSRKKRHVKTKKHIKYLESIAFTMGVVLVCDIENVE